MSKASSNLFTRVLKLGSALIGAIAILGGLIGFLVAGLPGLTSALIGASSVKQLEESHGAIYAPKFTQDELEAIEVHGIDGFGRS